MRKGVCFLLGAALIFLSQVSVSAHCEIPCGIYDDAMRVRMIEEDIATIAKAVKIIDQLYLARHIDYHQIVRWVNTKEQHAQNIQDIASQYFLAQRLKPITNSKIAAYRDYIRQITLLHQLIVYAGKSKQSTSDEPAKKLRTIIEEFSSLYFKR